MSIITLPFSDFLDLKLIRIRNTSLAYAIAENKILNTDCPAKKAQVINLIRITSDQAGTLNGMKIDGQEMLGASVALVAGSVYYFLQGGAIFATSIPAYTPCPSAIPFRETIKLDFTMGATAGTLSLQVWAYVHNDDDQEFNDRATKD